MSAPNSPKTSSASATNAPSAPLATAHWRQIALVCVAEGILWAGFGAILPILPLFLKEQAHTPIKTWSIIVATMYVGALALSSPLGRLSDRIGRKPLMVAGTGLYALATILFITTMNPWWFMLFRFFEGVGTAALTPAGNAFIADNTSDATRSKAFGWLTTAQFGGLVAGPALGILFNYIGGGGKGGFHLVCIAGFGMSLAMTVVLAIFVHESPEAERLRADAKHDERPRLRELLTRPVLAFMVIAVTTHYAMGGWETLWSWYLDDLGAPEWYIFATWLVFAVPMLFSFAFGGLADRGNRFLLMFSGYTLSAIAWVIYGLTRNLVVFMVVNGLEGVAIAYSLPAKQAFLVQVSPRRALGAIQGLEQTSMQIAMLIGTLTAPLLYDKIGGYAIGVGGFLSLAGLAATSPVLRREWHKIKTSGVVMSYAEAERLATLEAGYAPGDELTTQR